MNILIGLAIFCSILLVLIVLAQNSKGGGLTSQFGGSGASNIMGVKKTGDLLERLTWGFAIAVMVLSLTTSVVADRSATTESQILKNSEKQQPATLDLQQPTPTDEDE